MSPRTLLGTEARRTVIGAALLAAWVVLGLLGISSLGVSHMAAMPEPTQEARLARAALALRKDAARPFHLHVIYERCSCTRRLFAHLLKRHAFADVEETVLFVGESQGLREAVERAGFGFTTLAPGDLQPRFGLEAAPVLIAFDRSGKLQYAGGYFDRPAAVDALDERIRADLAHDRKPSPLPVFGCAVSPGLQERLDPLGIVYSRT
jgi:hypothetical protein